MHAPMKPEKCIRWFTSAEKGKPAGRAPWTARQWRRGEHVKGTAATLLAIVHQRSLAEVHEMDLGSLKNFTKLSKQSSPNGPRFFDELYKVVQTQLTKWT